ncbi:MULTISPECIES: cysteine-rich CWC family protein [Burkholderiaceae]|uniref:cysteine-rich CWC family protein n=1 Tax=Burkholderiaceae TaxID=119060 RepID=UPI00141EFF85|nr:MULTISPECIES: cysteine-rich CWC family protein [Burkholderiaceae]MBN3847122.1 cysteine-rich CWC family protein [Paraburkholderia sp. Ac-20342]NIF53142.1 cysteine-rich CWC family protein [Burkholderia sp. Ax-1724]
MNASSSVLSGHSARCSRCGSAFDCGMHAQPFDCWCRELQPLPAERLDPASRCLCPECLVAEIARARQGESGTEQRR